jgi:hypothetical protein
MYAITIAHTFDDDHHNSVRTRSQTFKWFSSTLIFDICGRAAIHLNHKYRTRISSASAVEGSDGSRMLLIKIQRPDIFQFKPGQYAFLKVSSLDQHWHPFSITSCPSAGDLEFYVDVFGPHIWTGKLWGLLDGNGMGGLKQKDITIEVMGVTRKTIRMEWPLEQEQALFQC